MGDTIAIERVDHIGIRVRHLDRALGFYRVLGFELAHRAKGDDVAIVRNTHGVELNLIFNANAGDPEANILMDIRDKFPGYTHMALRVASIPATLAALKANGIEITWSLCATPTAMSSNCAGASRAISRVSLATCPEPAAPGTAI